LKTSWPSTRTLSSRPFFEPDVATVPPSVNPHSIGSDAVFVDLNHLDPAAVERGTASEAGGTFALENYRRALTLARNDQVDAVCFTPFNKRAMRLARPGYDDEIEFSAELAGLQTPASEFNVLARSR
jgi:4-hydroxythreonine-4-phosphate dehydrogenase